MARRIQFRRGTTAQHAVFTGAPGELTVDTDKNIVVVHDGVTPGGFPSNKLEQIVGNVNFSGNVLVNSGIPSTSVTTGALVVSGGAGIAGRLTVNSGLFTSAVPSTSVTTGALVVSGGVGIAERLTANSGVFASSVPSTSVTTGALVVNGGVGIAGRLTVNNIVETSSIAFKENINPIENALNSILNLRGVCYDRKDGSEINETGLIAEEVDKIIPSLVTKDDNGNPYGVKYTKVVAYLVEAVKEQQKQIEDLKKRISDGLSG
jgi:hypothetical protein